MNNYSTENLTKRKLYFAEQDTNITGYVSGSEVDKTITGSSCIKTVALTDTTFITIWAGVDDGDGKIYAILGSIDKDTLSVTMDGNGTNYTLASGGSSEQVFRYNNSDYSIQLDAVKLTSEKVFLTYVKEYDSTSEKTVTESCIITISEDTITFGDVDTRTNISGTDPVSFIKLTKLSSSRVVVARTVDSIIYIYGYTIIGAVITYQDSSSISLENNLCNIIDLGNEFNFAICYYYDTGATDYSRVVIGSFDGTSIVSGADPISLSCDTDGTGNICQIKDKYFAWVYKDNSGDIWTQLCFADVDDMTTRILDEVTTEITTDISITKNTKTTKLFLLKGSGIIDPYTFYTGTGGNYLDDDYSISVRYSSPKLYWKVTKGNIFYLQLLST